MILTSCAGTYDIKGTSNVSVLDGKMLYLKQYHDSDLKNIDSCDVVHGQFGFNGRLDSVRMVTLFMDDENIMPVVLESGSINVKIDNGSQKVSGTPLNDKLSEFIEKYNQLEMQMNDLAHKQSQAIMNGEDENTINQKLAIEAQQITQKEDKLITSFICDNFDNVLGLHDDYGIPDTGTLAMDRRHHEQGDGPLQERCLREGLLSEGTAEPGNIERHGNARRTGSAAGGRTTTHRCSTAADGRTDAKPVGTAC